MSLPGWGWSQFSNGAVTTYKVPSDHILMATEPHVQVFDHMLTAVFI